MVNAKKLLAELIATPSVNPAFLPANDRRAGEAEVGNLLIHLAKKHGVDFTRQEVFPNRHNVLFRFGSSRPKQRILLAPHLDTVGGEGLNDNFFKPREKGGKMFGRGACDTKGSVAAMFTAFLQTAATPARHRDTEFFFAGLIDEECAQAGSRALPSILPKIDLALVGEPTELKLVTAHKWTYWLQCETHGVSAHGSKPELGQNAVHEMARVVELLEGPYRNQLRRRRHRLLGSPTMNVGTISGGSQPNIVPSHCSITTDRRTLPGETESSVRRELGALFKKKRLKVTMTNTQPEWCPALETSSRLPLVRLFQSQLRQKKSFGVDYFCDAAILAEEGIPSAVFGPGNIAQAHTADEWIEIRSLEGAVARLVYFLASLK